MHASDPLQHEHTTQPVAVSLSPRPPARARQVSTVCTLYTFTSTVLHTTHIHILIHRRGRQYLTHYSRKTVWRAPPHSSEAAFASRRRSFAPRAAAPRIVGAHFDRYACLTHAAKRVAMCVIPRIARAALRRARGAVASSSVRGGSKGERRRQRQRRGAPCRRCEQRRLRVDG